MPLIVFTLAVLLVALVSGAAVFLSGLNRAGGVLDMVFLLSVGGFLACLVVLIRRSALRTLASHLARLDVEDEEAERGADPQRDPLLVSVSAEERRQRRNEGSAPERRDNSGASNGMGSLRMSNHHNSESWNPRDVRR